MRLELRMFQGIKCRACDGFMHNHEDDCPQLKLEKFCEEKIRYEYRCPKCHGEVALNRADFFECRKCRAQFATGPACGEVAETLERAYLLNEDTALHVVVMTPKGCGKFRDDEIIEGLRREVAEAIQRRKKSTRSRGSPRGFR
jgi:hypothetical protein